MDLKINNIDDYIAGFPNDVQEKLEAMRNAIQQAAPTAKQKISYGMPTFDLNGNLVHFAGYKNHIGFYATPTGHEEFKDELLKYKQGKGSVQFPLNEPLPLDLVKRITTFRVQEQLAKTKRR